MIKKICLFLLLALLFFPLMEQCFSFNQRQWKIKKIDGYFPKVKAPIWTFKGWKEGDFQHQTTAYVKRNMSIRPLFYRFANQLHYSLLKEIRAKRVVEGKEGYLFELGYIEAFLGTDWRGEAAIEHDVERLKFIQKELKSIYQTELLVVLAPSKASYYAEYIPSYFYQKQDSVWSNSQTYIQGFQKNKIPYIDFESYFIAQKHKSLYPLFPKLGTHWSMYGGILAIDSILYKMSEMTGKNLAQLDLSHPLKVRTKPQGTDDDIAKGLNLFQKLQSDTLAYFEHYKKINDTHDKPKVILLGDSFIHTLWRSWIPHQYFDENSSQFWYYFNDVFAINSDLSGKKVANIDWFSFIKEADIIVMIYNPNTIKNFGHGFVGGAYEALKEGD